MEQNLKFYPGKADNKDQCSMAEGAFSFTKHQIKKTVKTSNN